MGSGGEGGGMLMPMVRANAALAAPGLDKKVGWGGRDQRGNKFT
jgi:hypothetical protein